MATALTFTGRPVRAVLDGPGAGWAVQGLDVRDWMGGDPSRDLDGLVEDAGATVVVGASTLATHGIEQPAVRPSVQVVDEAWQATATQSRRSVLHAVTRAITDPLVSHAIAGDAHDGVPVRTLGLHDGVYEATVLARSLDEQALAQVRLCADDCRRRGLAPPANRVDEYPAIVDAMLAASAIFVW